MNAESVRRAQAPRYIVTLRPVDLGDGRFRVTVVKGWWSGPGTGVTRRPVLDVSMIVDRHDTELDTIRAVLRLLADAL